MTRSHVLLGVSTILAAAACGGDKVVTPSEAECSTTTAVQATAAVSGSNVVFDWQPRCPMALVLIEEDASDMWAVSAPNLSGTSTVAANIIVPPVTYGQVPSGAEQDAPAEPLVGGQTYELILWKIAPTGNCQSRLGDACMTALKAFVR